MKLFGVEFEYDRRLINERVLHERMQRTFDAYYDCLSFSMWTKQGISQQRYSDAKHWTLKRDCSCGYEITSKKLPSTSEGIKELIRVSRILNRKEPGLTRYPTDSKRCGLHVHISRAGLTEATIDNFMHFLYLSSRVIYKMLRSEYRQTWGSYGSTNLQDYQRPGFFAHPTAYANIGSVRRNTSHRTIEIRFSRGLNNSIQIAAYVQFLLTALSICKQLKKNYFLKTYKEKALMEEFFDGADVEEFFDETATHSWLEKSKTDTLKTLKII